MREGVQRDLERQKRKKRNTEELQQQLELHKSLEARDEKKNHPN
jgi:hypothetical protein